MFMQELRDVFFMYQMNFFWFQIVHKSNEGTMKGTAGRWKLWVCQADGMAAKVKALLGWCKQRCDGYHHLDVTNFTSSWKNGLAFCAIIHRYRPDLM